jgi:serine protease Do
MLLAMAFAGDRGGSMKSSMFFIRAAAGLALACIGAAANAQAQTLSIEAQSRALSRASDAVIGLQVQAVEDASSAATLGHLREGSGVVISADGLVLTIGYLVLEAERVDLVTDDGRRIPAKVVAYDLATGFGLVQALAPIEREPVPLGDPAAVGTEEPLTVASGGTDAAVSVARLVSRRPFAGYWEYHIDGALFTHPPRRDHSGAGLFNGRGELLGVGSLFVGNAAAEGAPALPGNMFVPVDLLRPIMNELLQRGASRGSTRAWLGLNCVEQDGQVHVARVNDDSPAELAGVQRGDQVLAIDGRAVADVATLWKTLWAGGAPERKVKLTIRRGDERRELTLQSVDRAKTLKRARGI